MYTLYLFSSIFLAFLLIELIPGIDYQSIYVLLNQRERQNNHYFEQ